MLLFSRISGVLSRSLCSFGISGGLRGLAAAHKDLPAVGKSRLGRLRPGKEMKTWAPEAVLCTLNALIKPLVFQRELAWRITERSKQGSKV